MKPLALDLSKTSTGWSYWDGTAERPRFGHWNLGSEYTTDGGVFARLQANMADLYAVARFDWIYFEEPIHPANLSGNTNIRAIKLASGLAAHVESFGHALNCRTKSINVEQWRKAFIGEDIARQTKANARRRGKSARDTLKALTMERCRQLGMAPRKDDEADAIGILTYACELNHITPPWLASEVLRPMFAGAKA
jgi:hypothetical protein